MTSKNEDRVKRKNVCFGCGGMVPQVGPAQTVVIALCYTCKDWYIRIFSPKLDEGKDWRTARLETLQLMLEQINARTNKV
jgi:hypothetical protein